MDVDTPAVASGDAGSDWQVTTYQSKGHTYIRTERGTDPPPVAPGSQCARPDLSQPDEAALADLQRHWGDAYEVAHADEKWTARVRGEADVLTASTAAELGALIGQDYSDRRASASSRSSAAGSVGMSMGPGERALRQLRDDGVI
jgi:hypothetical protein